MFWDVFYNLCRGKNLYPNNVAKEIGISSGSVTLWKKGTVPNGGTLQKIAAYFGVSVDYLLGKEEEKKPAVDPLRQRVTELWEQLDEAGQEEAMRYLEYLRSRRKG